jgi:osmotically-inducible protein OsmY
MRKYGKWALTLGLLAAMPGLTFAAGEAQSPRSASQSGSANPNQAKAEEIAKALKAAGVKGKGIELEYQNGVVVIGGQVSDAGMRTTAERTIKRVPGVSGVTNQLTVARSTAAAATRSDVVPGGVVQAGGAERAGDRRGRIQKVNYAADNQAVAEQIGGALGAAGLEGYDIEVRFSNGVCTLAGEVDSPQQAAQAQQLVSQVPGVEQVSNRLRVPGMRPGMQPGMQGGPPAGPYGYPAMPTGYQGPGGTPMPMGPGVPAPPGYGHPGAGSPQAIYNQPNLPEHAWPAYAQYPNYAAVNYPSQYSASAFPYMGPFYPYPQVPMGWRDASLRWDDGQWNLQFNQRTDKWWWFMHPKNW